MNGGLSQFVRVTEALPYDAPLADRWNQLGEDIALWGRDIDAARDAHRADCLERYGCDIFAPEDGR